MITPHVGGVHADLQLPRADSRAGRGDRSTHGTFEWFLRESLERRLQAGLRRRQRQLTGRPGADRPGHQLRRYAKAGLTAVYAHDLTLEALHDGLRARRCYATTGARIVATLTADGHPMGSEYVDRVTPELAVTVSGTAPLERVEVYRGLDLHLRPRLHDSRRRRIECACCGKGRAGSRATPG